MLAPRHTSLDNLLHCLFFAGKFGTVYLTDNQCQANGIKHGCVVKVTTEENKAYWEQEQATLSHLGMAHDNIIRFIGAMCKEEKYCIVLEYHLNGSLFSYLKGILSVKIRL